MEELRVQQQARSQVLGVDPKLIVVFDLGTVVDPDEFRRSGLQVLDGSDRTVVVAFADDPQLTGFMDRLEACSAGVPPGNKSEPYADFVDAIDGVRRLTSTDRVSAELADAIETSNPEEILRLDVELWHPDKFRPRARLGRRTTSRYISD